MGAAIAACCIKLSNVKLLPCSLTLAPTPRISTASVAPSKPPSPIVAASQLATARPPTTAYAPSSR